jgi:hypothetical protein
MVQAWEELVGDSCILLRYLGCYERSCSWGSASDDW